MNSKRGFNAGMIRSLFGDENGIILMVVLIFMGILALVGATAVVMTTTDTKIGANYKASEKALYVAEAGANEARQRLRTGATGEITDAHTDKIQWRAFIGTDPKSQKRGYDSSNAMHVRTASFQTDLDYTVVITHQDDGAGNVLYWGDDDGDGAWTRNITTGENIYLITGYGNAEGSTKTVQLEVTRVPPITIKGALYSGTSATIQGNTTVKGEDGCGGADKAGVATPQPEASSPITVTGAAASVTGEGEADPNVSYSETQMDVQAMADLLKKSADFSYSVNGATHTASATPGPGDDWGTPTPGATEEDPSSCTTCNIVHYDTNDTDIKLSGGATGCGILVVEGDLDASGDFSWYGIIIITGAFRFTGGGNKNITGAVITGSDTDGDLIGGNTSIIYCSTATESQSQNHALPILSWKEVLAE